MSHPCPSRAEVWLTFAAAALRHGEMSPENAAQDADKALTEFDKRFEWYDGIHGTFWKPCGQHPAAKQL